MQAVRSKPSTPALVGRGRDRLRGMAPMRERQPGSQLLDGLLRGLAVEGHHGGWHAGVPAKLGTPPVADGHHLDLVRTPGNRFFEMLNGHLCGGSTFQSGAGVILRRRHVRSSEDDREGPVHSPRFRGSSADPREEKSALSGSAQDLHASSTVFPQTGESDTTVRPAGLGKVECESAKWPTS
jgi:hypothetical protein